METTLRVRNKATRKGMTIGVQVVREDKFAHLGAIARNDEGKRYIMRGYTDDMKGTKIPDSMVVKPMNARCDVALFRQGSMTDEGQGDFEFPDREVER
jgi:hypothetical protein